MRGFLTLPRLGETMEEGRIVAWLVAPGTAYKRGDALLEVETDKTVVEVPALEDGELAEILVPEGAQVSVGALVARLSGTEVDGEPLSSDLADAATPASFVDHSPPPAAPAHSPLETASATADAGIRATPVARRLASQAGIDLRTIPGTGRRNRIERGDVERHVDGRGATQEHGLAYSLSGPETGPAVLLLHGFGGDHTLWSGLSAGLVRAGRRVLAPDLPGHGATQRDAMVPADLSEGLDDLVSGTIGGPVHVVAHSLGAIPAVALAENAAAQSVTLIAPAGLGLGIDRGFIRGLAAARTAGEVTHLLERMTETPLALSTEALAGIAETLGKGRLNSLADALVGAAGQTVSLRASLAKLAETLPVRIIAPHRDRILDWADMVTVSPRIAVHHLPHAGHMAEWDAPQEVLAIVRAASES